ncbi:MAG: bacteriohemerythrin [Syntrophomonas sp.]|nr:bacteriohemerythrin [Syntrophomonas sp.]
MITWSDEYRVGVKEVDEQHRQLFAIAGRAYELLKNEMLTDKYDSIIEILQELKAYAVYHFQYEEEYMDSIGYAKLLSHKVMHADFVEKINGIDFRKVDDNQGQYLMEILEFVVKWIEGHILGQDKKYAGLV